MSIAISSQIQLIQYFGESPVNIAEIGNISNVDTIYRVFGGAYQAWINGQPEASAFSTLDPGDGYLIISNTSPYTLDDGQNTESFPDATFITQPIEIRRHFGGSVDLNATTHNYKQIYKITDGAYSVWIQDSPANGFSTLENGETYLIFSLDSLTSENYPYAFSTISQGEKVYITNYDNNSVDILDLSSKSLSGSITGLYYPTDIIVDSVKGLAYVAELSARTVAVIDLTTNTLKKRIPLNSKHDIAPDKLYKDESGNLLYVMSSYTPHVAIIDLSTDQVEDYISSFELNSRITDATKSGNEMYFLNSSRQSVYEVEDKPGIEKFDNPIYPSFHATEGGKLSCSDDGNILAFKVGSNAVKFYSRLGNDYITHAQDFRIPSDYTIYQFEISGDGKHFAVLYGSTAPNDSPVFTVFTINPVDHSWTLRASISSTDTTTLLTSMAINFDASSVFVAMLDTEFDVPFIQNYHIKNDQFSINGSRLYQDNIRYNNVLRLITNHSGDTFALANPSFNDSFVKMYKYDTSSRDFYQTGEINSISQSNIFGTRIKMNALGTKIVLVADYSTVYSYTYTGVVMGWTSIGDPLLVDQNIIDLSISNSGNTMVVGTPLARTPTARYSGAFSVYTFSNSKWHLADSIYGNTINEMLGNGVSINGDASIFFVSTGVMLDKLSATPYHLSLDEFIPPPSTSTTATPATTTTATPATTTTATPATTTTTAVPPIEYTVTVENDGSGNKFYINGTPAPSLTLSEGSTYIFDQSSPTNNTHPIRFSETPDGTHGGGTEYTNGVTHFGIPGSAGAYTQFIVPIGAPDLYYYCANHSGMGGSITTS
jgi:DNA-binding beta-propeller fold protein YncE